uniref:Uncharacterized protein n=1 Tax=Cacopsylla melanoneura TaxID=428564 RepID=A0A8D9AK54_9HEMI
MVLSSTLSFTSFCLGSSILLLLSTGAISLHFIEDGVTFSSVLVVVGSSCFITSATVVGVGSDLGTISADGLVSTGGTATVNLLSTTEGFSSTDGLISGLISSPGGIALKSLLLLLVVFVLVSDKGLNSNLILVSFTFLVSESCGISTVSSLDLRLAVSPNVELVLFRLILFGIGTVGLLIVLV